MPHTSFSYYTHHHDYPSYHIQHKHFLPPISYSRKFEHQWHQNERTAINNNFFERKYKRVIIPSISTRVLTSQSSTQFEISYEIHDGFTTNEEIIIKNALRIVANRLFKPEVLQNMYRICGKAGYFLAPGLWKRSNLSKHSVNHGKEFLLQYQLMCLKIKGEHGEFPTIHIYPIYQKTEVVARGTFACISCISHHSTFVIDGQFEVKLNRYHLNSSNENGLDAVEWAGVIVHEMLHNLGHNHDHYDYSDRWQMNIFKECFVHDGNYLP